MAKRIIEYKSSGFSYPADNINPDLKRDESYAIAYCEALMADYANGRCHVPFQYGEGEYSIDTLRMYATGMEGNDTVKKNFFGESKKDPTTGKYPTSITSNWDGMDVMPKMFDVMRSINQKIDYKTTTRSVDPDSLQAKQMDKDYLKFLIQDQTKRLLARAKYKPSVPVSLEEIGAETESDVDLYFDSGAFVTQREIASDAACQKTKLESAHKTIQDMVFDDLITIAVSGVKTYIDWVSKCTKVRYLDPKNCIIPYSKYLDFRNINRAAELREMGISELREEYSHITASQWIDIANDFSWMNSEYSEGIKNARSEYNQNPDGDRYGIDPVNAARIQVMDAQWLSVDYEYYLTNKNNKNLYKPVKYGYTVYEKDKKRGDRVEKKKVVRKYYASWIVGTKILLDHGVCNDQVYYGPDGNKTPKLDFFFTKTGNKSLVERCIPHIEDVHLAAVKRRNAISVLPPGPRMIIQQQLMDNVFLNGKKQQPEELFQTFTEKGYLVVNNLDDFNKPIFQNAKAIDFVPAGVLEDITIFTNEINQGIERIREVTGLNATVDASTPNSYVGLGKSQMAANAANNALSPTFNSFNNMNTRCFEDVIKKWQIIAKKNKGLKLTYSPLGVTSMQVLELGEEFTNADFNIYMEMEYTDDERALLLQQILELSKMYVSSQGGSGLSTAEYMHLHDLIMSGSFKYAKFVIARTERKREIAAMKFKRESEILTFENQRKSLEMNNKYNLIKVQDEARKEILKARITGAEARKTKLVEALTESETNAGASPFVNNGLIEKLISETDMAITKLLQEDMVLDQQRMAELTEPQNNDVAA